MTEHSCLTARGDRPPPVVADRAPTTGAGRVGDFGVTVVAAGVGRLTRTLGSAEAA